MKSFATSMSMEYTAEQIASAMSTDINLVALKVAHLATLGYNLHALEHKSNFLK